MKRSTLSDLATQASEWLTAKGRQSNIVLSSRVRLARNLRSVPFPHRAGEEDLLSIRQQVEDVLDDIDSDDSRFPLTVHMESLDTLDRQLLVERHIASRELAEDGHGRGVRIGAGEFISVMVNEEDHLRIQALQSGLAVEKAWQEASGLEAELEQRIPFAFSREWGYLTACPTNTGSGLRASVLVHLPGLVLTKQIQGVLHGIGQTRLSVRGLFGEGSEVMGNFFQISNQIALGEAEKEIIDHLERVTRQIIEREERAEEVLLKDARPQLEDKIWRAYGILQNCRSISSQEVLSLTSAVRLGVSTGVIGDVPVEDLNRLLVLTRPAHLQRAARRRMDAIERDVKRAEMARAILGGGTPGVN